MSETPDKRTTAGTTRRPRGVRVVRMILYALGSVVVFIVLALTGLTLYLSGGRLSRIVNEKASEYFEADVRTGRCDFRVWSTFPRLCVEIDTLQIVSRTLRGRLSASEKQLVGRDADSLASLRSLRGAVNVVDLMAGKIELHDVEGDGLNINLVAVNDSVNNYNIVPPSDDAPFKMPYFSANSIRLTNIERLHFNSVPDNLTAQADVDSARLERHGRSNSYDLLLGGNISAQLDSIHLCRHLPFLFGGEVQFGFDPFAVTLRDMRVNLANMESRVSLGMNLGEKSGIDDFRTEVSAFDLMKLLAYLPSQFLPSLKGLNTDLRTRLSIRLTEPYHFSDAGLPSFIAELTVPSSSLTYTLDNGESYTLNDISLKAELNFNGHEWQNSDCSINELRACGDGLSLLLNGDISQVFTNPQFAANVHLSVDVPQLATAIPSMATYKPKGSGEIDMKVDFPVSMLTSSGYTHIPVEGTSRLRDLAVTLPDGTTVGAAGAALTFSNKAGNKLNLDGKALADGVNVKMADGTEIKAPDITLSASLIGNDYNVNATIPSTNMVMPQKGLALTVKGLNASYTGTDIAANAAGLTFASKAANVGAKDIDADITLNGKNTTVKLTATKADADLGESKKLEISGLQANMRGLSDIHAGSNALKWSMPDFDAPGRRFRANASNWRGSVALGKGMSLKHVSLDIPYATLRTAVYDAPVSISNLRADMAGLDSITLHSLNVRSQLTGMNMNGGILMRTGDDGHKYYSGHTSIHFDTLHFNQIARTIESGSLYHGNRPGVDPKDPEAEPREYHAMMVSPYFDVSADVTADATVYTNLWLTDLGAQLSMQPGRIAIDTLYLSANFGHAQAAVEYLSPQEDKISMNGGFHIQNFNLTKFFESYPKVLAMMPEMGNLHGLFHADAYLGTGIFPNMELNTASMLADISASATDMYLHQTPFIRRVARMALIFEDGNINIPTIHARARIYDHLLTVEPFDIELGKYRLEVAGRNDFSGNLYYHVGVIHNPLLPIRFGIDIRGKYGDPHIRFARSGFNIKRSEAINGVDATDHINLIKELHHGGLLLLHHAAKAEVLSADPTR